MNRIKNKGTMTIWVRHSEVKDDRFHVHIGDNNYIIHTHQHRIDDIPKKIKEIHGKVCI